MKECGWIRLAHGNFILSLSVCSFFPPRWAFVGGQAVESPHCLWPFSIWWMFLKVKPPCISS